MVQAVDHVQQLRAFIEVLNALPYRAGLKDPMGCFIFVNNECAKAMKIADASLAIGKTDTYFFSGDHPRNARADEDQIISTGQPMLDREEYETWNDGRINWVLTSKIPVKNESGKVLAIAFYVQDITRTKEELLRYQRALAGTHQGLWSRDLATGRIWFSDRYKEILGFMPDDPAFPDHMSEWKRLLHPEDLSRVEEETQRHLDGHTEYYQCEFRMKHKRGEWRWVRARAKAHRGPDGKLISMSGSHEDITDSRNLQLSYLSLLDSFPGLVWVKDKDLRFRFVNQKIAEVYGSRRDEIIGRRDVDFRLRADELEQFHRDDLQVVSTKRALPMYEEVLTGRDGIQRVLATTKVPFDGDKVLAWAIDITELAQMRETLRMLMEFVPDGIFFKDLEGRFIQVNPAMAAVAARTSPDEVAGLTDADLFTPEYAAEERADEAEIIRTGMPLVNKVMPTPTKDGIRHRLVTKIPLRDIKGNIIQICGISKDISELVETRQRLAEHTNLLKNIFDGLPQFIFVKDTAGRYVICNESFARRHDSSVEDIIGKDDFDLWPNDIAAAQRSRQGDFDVLTGRQPKWFRETQFLKGKLHTIETTKIPIFGEGDEPIRVLGIYEDVSERLEKDKAEFQMGVARTIGHCLREGLIISGSILDLLVSRDPELAQYEYFGILKSEIRRLLQAAILATEIASLERGLDQQPVQVEEVIDYTVRAVQDSRVQFSRSGGNIICRGSSTHLPKVILELIQNARRHAGNGDRAAVRIWADINQERCRIQVVDTGPGVAADLRDSIFEFSRSGAKRTGLGLAYAKLVCELCGGAIRLAMEGEPAPEGFAGAHFIIELPLWEETGK